MCFLERHWTPESRTSNHGWFQLVPPHRHHHCCDCGRVFVTDFETLKNECLRSKNQQQQQQRSASRHRNWEHAQCLKEQTGKKCKTKEETLAKKNKNKVRWLLGSQKGKEIPSSDLRTRTRFQSVVASWSMSHQSHTTITFAEKTTQKKHSYNVSNSRRGPTDRLTVLHGHATSFKQSPPFAKVQQKFVLFSFISRIPRLPGSSAMTISRAHPCSGADKANDRVSIVHRFGLSFLSGEVPCRSVSLEDIDNHRLATSSLSTLPPLRCG